MRAPDKPARAGQGGEVGTIQGLRSGDAAVHPVGLQPDRRPRASLNRSNPWGEPDPMRPTMYVEKGA